MSLKTQFTTLACAAALAVAASAQAAPQSTPYPGTEPTSVRVSVADLDLGKDAGAAVALRRIHRAAVVICGDEPLSSGLHRHALSQSCVKSSVRAALASSSAQLAKGPDAIEMVLAASH